MLLTGKYNAYIVPWSLASLGHWDTPDQVRLTLWGQSWHLSFLKLPR